MVVELDPEGLKQLLGLIRIQFSTGQVVPVEGQQVLIQTARIEGIPGVELGDNTEVDLTVEWPSGATDSYTGVPASQLYRVTEGVGIEAVTLGGPQTTISVSPVSVAEAGGSVDFTVSLSSASTAPARIMDEPGKQVSERTPGPRQDGALLSGARIAPNRADKDLTRTKGHFVPRPMGGAASGPGNRLFARSAACRW